MDLHGLVRRSDDGMVGSLNQKHWGLSPRRRQSTPTSIALKMTGRDNDLSDNLVYEPPTLTQVIYV